MLIIQSFFLFLPAFAAARCYPSTCPTGMTCSPNSFCTTEGCRGACVGVPAPTLAATPATYSSCVIGSHREGCRSRRDEHYTCTPNSYCTTPGCHGLCLPITRTQKPQACIITSAPPTPTTYCKIGDYLSSCAPEPVSTCIVPDTCTTAGCEGYCEERPRCDPSTTFTGNCAADMYCSSYSSGIGYCISTTTVGPVVSCKIDDYLSSCAPEPVSTCIVPDTCTTAGCEGYCEERPRCDPSTTFAGNCAADMYCSSYSSGVGYCISTTTIGPVVSCKIDDPASSCAPEPIMSCVVPDPACTTAGCAGTCSERPRCNPSTTFEGNCSPSSFCSSYSSGIGYCKPTLTAGDVPVEVTATTTAEAQKRTIEVRRTVTYFDA